MLSEESEATRYLVRAYEDIVSALKKVKTQCSALLLQCGYVRNEYTITGNLKATWNREYIAWASSIDLGQPQANRTLKLYLKDVSRLTECTRQVKAECLELSENPRYKPCVDALCRLKGVDRMLALLFVVTIDDFSRFPHARSVSFYFGFVPARHDSGEKTGRTGKITKAGDSLVRKAAVEGLLGMANFNGGPKTLPKGCVGSNAIEIEAGRCNQRNVSRYKALVKSWKESYVVKIAVAKELVRQMWILGCMVYKKLTS